ncbi:hypothetical protein JB92DRAFT_3123781 [Gautieria morchelliformis]|nr:hypothetical protein JB92DRAFT_3123781 [Gautieria morchelliformis]
MELDLLEIRMHKLDAVINRFFIIESDCAFTGIPKAPIFSQNRAHFDAFASKIVYTDDVTAPWMIFDQGEDTFALQWEVKALKDLSTALYDLIKLHALNYHQPAHPHAWGDGV